MGRVPSSRIKIVGIISFTTFIIITVCIIFSTIFIDKDRYRSYAWDYINHDKSTVNWKTADVESIYLPQDKILINPYKFMGELNRILLNINGNHAVRVTFKTETDVLTGPLVMYISPITKQIIGIELSD